ncbi:opioid growth factor receptor conserved region-domain-containing protein [Pterulicium gracile]|uniref:Opioid growth factor receptor conserved region-domain-containing protein n=1 Tax=Pterulicium gracile TaxID=1884261 RepID=A0A5C3QKA0_9AGAR|nr:opioid growth factor receptor conserved region-domain-containing protein [Pterula gracilis]
MPYSSIPNDVQEFLDGYPDVPDDKRKSANLKFYSNEQRCSPDNMLIDEIHDDWVGEYQLLEQRHGYIQWLFPIQEHGMNYQSQPLQKHELQAMKADPQILARLIKSYQLMLDFYGMKLVDKDTGLLSCSLPPRDFEPRYRNFMSRSHNNLRISRIMKCLSEFGLERLNVGFLLHVLNEQSENGQLNSPGLTSSMDRWWANCIRNDATREWLGTQIKQAREDRSWVFTREQYEEAMQIPR